MLLHDGETGQLRAILTPRRSRNPHGGRLGGRDARARAPLLGRRGDTRRRRPGAVARRGDARRAAGREIRTWRRRDGGTPEDLLPEADVVCTCTSAREPIVEHAWLSWARRERRRLERPDARELDAETVAAATLVVDRRESALNESGDLLMAGFGRSRSRPSSATCSSGTHPGARRRRADGLQVARPRVEDLAARSSSSARRASRASAPRSTSDRSRGDRARPRDDRRAAIRTLLVRLEVDARPRSGSSSRTYSHRLVQDPRRRQRDPERAGGGDRARGRHRQRREHGAGVAWAARELVSRRRSSSRRGRRRRSSTRSRGSAGGSSRCPTRTGGRSPPPASTARTASSFIPSRTSA